MCLAHSRFSIEIFIGGIFPSSLNEVPFGHYPLAVKTVLRKYRWRLVGEWCVQRGPPCSPRHAFSGPQWPPGSTSGHAGLPESGSPVGGPSKEHNLAQGRAALPGTRITLLDQEFVTIYHHSRNTPGLASRLCKLCSHTGPHPPCSPVTTLKFFIV